MDRQQVSRSNVACSPVFSSRQIAAEAVIDSSQAASKYVVKTCSFTRPVYNRRTTALHSEKGPFRITVTEHLFSERFIP